MKKPPPKNDAAPLAGGVGVNDSNFHPHDSDLLQLKPLAEELGVSVSSLAAIGFRRVGDEWHNPERNDQGEIIGWSRRLDSGKKLFKKGSKRGLTLCWPLDPYAGTSRDNPILIVEGASDTVAGLDLGFVTIGRPSATGGLGSLLPLLKGLHAVVVAENDKAGYLGAEKVAAALASVMASARAILPPADCKDLRGGSVRARERRSVRQSSMPSEAQNPTKPRRSLRPTGAPIGAARMGWLVAEDPNDKDRRLMVNIKANITRGSTGLAFRVAGDPPTIRWEDGPVSMTADELLAAQGDDESQSEIEEAMGFLQAELAEGPRPAREIEQAAKAALISQSTLKRAKKRLRVESVKISMGSGWEWKLPEEDHQSRR